MAIANWMRLRGRLRPWMVLAALAVPAAAGGCRKAETSAAGAQGDVGGAWVATPGTDGGVAPSRIDGPGGAKAADACQQVALYGPAPACSSDEQCVEQHGAGWVCERGTYAVDDGCGGEIQWPTGACRPAAGGSADAGAAAEGD